MLLFSLTLRRFIEQLERIAERKKIEKKNTHTHNSMFQKRIYFSICFVCSFLIISIFLSLSRHLSPVCLFHRARKVSGLSYFFFLKKEVYYKWSKCHGFWYICIIHVQLLPNFQNTWKINGWSHLILEKSHIHTNSKHTVPPIEIYVDFG